MLDYCSVATDREGIMKPAASEPAVLAKRGKHELVGGLVENQLQPADVAPIHHAPGRGFASWSVCLMANEQAGQVHGIAAAHCMPRDLRRQIPGRNPPAYAWPEPDSDRAGNATRNVRRPRNFLIKQGALAGVPLALDAIRGGLRTEG